MSARDSLTAIWGAAGGEPDLTSQVEFAASGALPSVFAVSDLAAGSVAAAGLAVAELVAACGRSAPELTVDRRLASFWFSPSIRPQGWTAPALWDAVAGDYPAADGWIRLHTNAPHHQAAALSVLGVAAERAAVARAVAGWRAGALEAAVVAAGGCAAEMRDRAAWAAHPQGRAVAAEPLVLRQAGDAGPPPRWAVPPARPLQGVRVLDMTRVLAGPVATRFLAGFGAEVLRIDAPDWEEPGVVPDMTLGKACARLDLREPASRAAWEGLLAGADVLVHGYRPGALERLGLGPERRRALRPGLVEVSLDAYGWTGPWARRRGFDSLVQMSCGIAEAGMRQRGADRPTPLPVQALDHATGYIMAACTVRGLAGRLQTGAGAVSRVSLARTAALLMEMPAADAPGFAAETEADLMDWTEATAWGSARRLRPACTVSGAPMQWDRPAGHLGAANPVWGGSLTLR